MNSIYLKILVIVEATTMSLITVISIKTTTINKMHSRKTLLITITITITITLTATAGVNFHIINKRNCFKVLRS